jgi:RNA polymerase sigma-70 factor (ECF subfamily)
MEGVLRRLIRRYCRNASDVEEVLQEALVRIFGRGDIPVGTRSSRALILTIVRNVAIDFYRGVKCRPLEFHADPDLLESDEAALQPETIVNAQQELSLLLEAVALLPERCRQVFWMRRVLDLSPGEIATNLNITVNTVEVHLRNARKHLADNLAALEAARLGSLSDRLHKLKTQG